ncbi:MAG: hypothetical protein SVU32_01065 [Candidatus Nanohaloarchaea archaeon]|nr:hypothetical protein [Candidatus Nanohaloarchaea archaeon]
MNEVRLPKIARDLNDELDGLRWAFTGETAYQVYTGNTTGSNRAEAVMHLRDYGEAALRTDSETDTEVNQNGLKVFRLELERHATPVIFRTTSLEEELGIFDRLEERDYHETTVSLVPPEYLLAQILSGNSDNRQERLNQLRDETELDQDYLRECMRVLGIEDQILRGDTD